MLRKFFGTARQVEAVAPRVAADSRVYAVGDIHGRADLLRHLHQLIHEDAYAHQAARNVVVYLGDYVDRGESSREVIDILLDEPLPAFERFHIKGNHEESFLRFLDDTSIAAAWLAFGGSATLFSYGVRPPDVSSDKDLQRAQEELRAKLPPRHLDFLRGLALSHAEGDYLFVHAGVKPGVPLDRQNPDDLLWIRDEFLSSSADYGKIIVHGHTISHMPEVRRNRIGIDTGAFASGRLTCLVLSGEEWLFLHT